MRALSERQRRFAEYYSACLNATNAAKRAGYEEKSAARAGSKLLQDERVQIYIQEILTTMRAQRVASAEDVLAFYSDIMRGEKMETQVLTLKREEPLEGGKGARKEEVVETVVVPPRIREAMQAAQVLAAVHGIGKEAKTADDEADTKRTMIIDDIKDD